MFLEELTGSIAIKNLAVECKVPLDRTNLCMRALVGEYAGRR